MNDGNRILEVQNESRVIELLGAQRELYRRAKAWQRLSLTCGIAIPFLLTVLEVALPFQVPLNAFVIVEASLFTATLLSKRRVASLVDNASSAQQLADSIIYGIQFDHVNVDGGTITEMYEADSARDYPNRPLENWYRKEIGGLPAEEAISRCQRMNAEWSSDLAGKLSLVVAATCILGIAIVIWSSTVCKKELASIFFVFTFIECAIQTILDGHANYVTKRDLSKACSSFDLSGEKNIRMAQDRILEYRSNPAILVPDWLYALRRNVNESRARHMAAARSNGGER